MARIQDLTDGVRVSWSASQKTITGRVLRKAVCNLAIGGTTFEASPRDPRFIVSSDEGGELAAYKAADLTAVEEHAQRRAS